MSTKSYVTHEQKICIVCGCQYGTDALLLDKSLRHIFDSTTVTGFGLCPKDQALYDQGYIALVEIDPTKSVIRYDTVKQEGAHRTGVVAHIKKGMLYDILKTVQPFDGPLLFVEDGLIAKLQAMIMPS